MESADFYENYSAVVECPYCEFEFMLDEQGSRYCEGEEVTCENCGKVFELGESI